MDLFEMKNGNMTDNAPDSSKPGLRAIGVGDAVTDQYLSLETIFPGGCCVNFAAYAADLGASSAFMGVFGSLTLA